MEQNCAPAPKPEHLVAAQDFKRHAAAKRAREVLIRKAIDEGNKEIGPELKSQRRKMNNPATEQDEVDMELANANLPIPPSKRSRTGGREAEVSQGEISFNSTFKNDLTVKACPSNSVAQGRAERSGHTWRHLRCQGAVIERAGLQKPFSKAAQ